MKSILQGIQADLDDFIVNPTLSLLVVACKIEHSALLIKSLDALEQDPAAPDIFLTFGHEFNDQPAYVEGVLATVRQEVAQISEELAKRGEPLSTEPPIELEDRSLAPPARLVGILRYVRNLVPNHRQVICIFYPQEIIDPPRYLQLIEYVLAQMDDPSLRGVKLIARDADSPPTLAPRLEGLPRTKVYRPELDPDSFEKLLQAKAKDTSVPAEERAQMHMMLAGYDVANRRFDVALDRNQELLRYFAYTKQEYNQSIVLNNIGDLYYIQKKWGEAQSWYERAIAMSVGLQSQPLVLYQCLNLGNALLMQKKFAESLIYYRAGEKSAERSGAVVLQIQALERIGSACHESGQLEESAEAWEKAAGMNEKINNIDGARADLEQLCRVYSDMGDKKRLQECRSRLSKLSASENGSEV
jgi:tetratricopeptide (TPR) repeat protein